MLRDADLFLLTVLHVDGCSVVSVRGGIIIELSQL